MTTTTARWGDAGAKAGGNILRWCDREYDGDDVRTMIMERWHNEDEAMLYRVIMSALLCHDHRMFSFYSHIQIPYPQLTSLQYEVNCQKSQVSQLWPYLQFSQPNTSSSEMQGKCWKIMYFSWKSHKFRVFHMLF